MGRLQLRVTIFEVAKLLVQIDRLRLLAIRIVYRWNVGAAVGDLFVYHIKIILCLVQVDLVLQDRQLGVLDAVSYVERVQIAVESVWVLVVVIAGVELASRLLPMPLRIIALPNPIEYGTCAIFEEDELLRIAALKP